MTSVNTMSRRAVLLWASGGTTWIMTGCAGVSARWGPAFAPWSFPEGERRPELLAVRAAILAASPHNTQPWRFGVREEAIEVHADLSRGLGAMDSLQRELHLGLGCAIENAALTARAWGRSVEVQVFPDGGAPTLVARLVLRDGKREESPLVEAIPRRRTNRFPYGERALPEEVVRALPTLVEHDSVELLVLTDEESRRRMRRDCVDAVSAITKDAEMAEASHRWWRQTRAEVEAHRDGLNLDGLGLEGLARWFAGMPSRVSTEEAGRYWVDAVKGRQTTGAAYVIIATTDRNSREQQLAAGRAYQRAALWLTTQGVDSHPLNMLPEMQDREETTAAPSKPFTGRAEAWVPEGRGGLQLIARLGYAARRAVPSPRRGIDAVLT